MAHNTTSSDLTGPCEKFFGAITGTTALRAMRRVSLRPQTPKPNIPAAGTLPPKYDPSTKKTVISFQPVPPNPLPIPISDAAAKPHPGPGIGEAAELVPIMFVPADEKKKSMVEITGLEKNFPITIIVSEMAPELQVASQKQEVGLADQSARAKPNTEPALSMAQPEKLIKQKIILEMQIPTSNKATGQSHGQGAKPTPTFEAAAFPVSFQDKPMPLMELKKKPVLEQGQKEEGNKIGHHNIDDRCSAYIDRAKNKLRATSDVGKSNTGADSSDAKVKTKTASNVGVGKSASFEK